MFWRWLLAAGLLWVSVAGLEGAEYRLEATTEAAPAEGIAAAIREQLSPTGAALYKGKNRLICEIWVTKQWTTEPDFKPSSTVIYPFRPGDFLGVVRYKSKGKDFRGQSIPAGLYILRYGQQPVDGNHVGTSATRDFLVLTPAAEDQSTDLLDEKALNKLSGKVVGGKHPAMLCLVQPTAVPDAATLREAEEWWIVVVPGKKNDGDKSLDQPLEFVIIGESKG